MPIEESRCMFSVVATTTAKVPLLDVLWEKCFFFFFFLCFISPLVSFGAEYEFIDLTGWMRIIRGREVEGKNRNGETTSGGQMWTPACLDL